MIEHDKVYNMDCLDIFKEIPSESIDLVITDPPYRLQAGGVTVVERGDECKGVLNKRKSGVVVQGNDNDFYLCGRSSKKWVKKNGSMPSAVKSGKMFENNDIEFAEWLPEVYRVLKKGTHCYIMCNNLNMPHFFEVIGNSDFHFVKMLVWDKCTKICGRYFMGQVEFIFFLRKGKDKPINNCGVSDLLTFQNIRDKDQQGKNIHDSQKPIGLMQTLVQASSDEGQTVLDPFMGSGTTAIACIRTNRNFVGFELDKEYYDKAQKRINAEQSQLSLF